jgi:hypothetical protein
MPGQAWKQRRDWPSSFPVPKHLKVFDTVKSKSSILFFEYWEKLSNDPEFCDRVRVKVFRTWPQTDVRIVEPERKDVSLDTLDGKIPFPPAEYLTWFLETYYSGEWNCQMYEVTGDKNPMVMQCYFGSIDLEKYPPRVDLRIVSWGKTANKSYEQYLRSRNIPIPGDAEYKEAQDMTAGAALIQELAKQNGELAKENRDIVREQLHELKEEKVKEPDQRSNSGSFALDALRGYMDVVNEGAKAAIEVSKSRDMSQAKSYDPLEMIEKTMGIIAAAKGDGGGGTAMVQLVLDHGREQARIISEMHNQTLGYMKERDQRATVQTPGGGLEGIVGELQKLETLGKALGWSRRGGNSEAEAPVPQSGGFGKIIEKLVENPANLQAVAGIVAVGAQMVMALLGKTPAPVQMPEVPKSAEVQKPEPAKEEPKQPTPEERNFMFLEWIEVEFLRCFKDDALGGRAFAETFVSMVQTEQGAQFAPGGPPTLIGMQQLGLLRQSGIQSFDRLIRSYAPIWSQVQSYAVQDMGAKEPPKYWKFLQDFFSYNPARATA